MTRVVVLFMAAVCFAAQPTLSLAQTASGQTAPSYYAQQKAPQPAIRTAVGQQPITQPAAAAGPAVPSPTMAMPVLPQPPEWVGKLTPAEQKWINDVLGYWEARSNKIKTFECKFKRWDYEPTFGPKDEQGRPKNEPKTYAEGVIKYAEPDKGAFQVEILRSYVAPAKPGDPGSYVNQDADFGEHWVCDGKQIFAYEAPKKQLTVTPLPPEMQGKAIADGPLPFMFGAKANTIKARYWVHEMPAEVKQHMDGKGEGKYCLEAVPKTRDDAQNFSRVRIVLDGKEFLPEIMEVFAPNYDPHQNPTRQTYVFTDRQATDEQNLVAAIAKGLDPLKLFHRNFYEPKTPAGWKKVMLNNVAPAPLAPASSAARPAGPPLPGQPVTR